ncbi:caspase family protein [Catenulispora yoronensis]
MLIGNGQFADSRLVDHEDVIRRGVIDLYAKLTDPEYGSFLPEHCATLLDERDQGKVGRVLTRAADEALDLLLVYYAGHGVTHGARSLLHLAMPDTDLDSVSYTAIPYDRIRETCVDSPARCKIVIIDCCYSGRAAMAMGAEEAGVLAQLEISGTYTLTSAPPNQPSLVRPGELHTVFTGRLIKLLHAARSEPELLTMDQIFTRLRKTLASEGLPRPHSLGTENAAQAVLVGNSSWQSHTDRIAAALTDEVERRRAEVEAWAARVTAESKREIERARQEADRILAEADRKATQIRDKAAAIAEHLVVAAEKDAEALRFRSAREAELLVRTAKAETQPIAARARALRRGLARSVDEEPSTSAVEAEEASIDGKRRRSLRKFIGPPTDRIPPSD